MAKVIRGTVRADGTSTALPEGVYDQASLGLELQDPELEARVAEICKTQLPTDSKAKFKLDIWLLGGARRMTEVRGLLQGWASGGMAHGGGDISVYWCPRQQENKRTCLNPIDVTMSFNSTHGTQKYVVCTKCRRITKVEDLVGQLVAELTIQQWAALVTRMFYVLECNADLKVIPMKTSLIKATKEEMEKTRGGDLIYDSMDKEEVIYPLHSIVKDTATGATLETRIKAFLEA